MGAQRKPKKPMLKNADRHPNRPRSAKIAAGASTAPKAAPLSKIPLPSVRSSGGSVRAMVRKPAGQLGASVTPRKKRKTIKLMKPVATPVSPETRDQASTAMATHHRKLNRSSRGPTAN